MKISELIVKLATIADAEGDLEVLTRSGEMGDPDPVTEANVVNVNARDGYYYIPWDQNTVTNAKAVEVL